MTTYTSLSDIEVLRFKALADQPGLTHFITTRNGADSSDPYSSFNICHYTDDNPQSVSANRSRLAEALQITTEAVIVPRQVHGEHIAVVTRPGFDGEADALITNRPGLCLTVSTADCVPVLIYCPEKRVIAAVHAGWRGMVKRIVSKTVRRMVEEFGCEPSNLRAVIGPSISPTSFEVGVEVAIEFEKAGMASAVLPSLIPGKAYVDLWDAAKGDLLEVGIRPAHIETAAICTYQQHERFFSARRLGIRSGRISSGILLK